LSKFLLERQLRGSLARIILRALGMVLIAMTYAIAARKLSAEDMGIWALATTLTALILSLDLGLSSALRNRLANQPLQGALLFQQVFTLTLILALAYAALILIAAFISFAALYPSSLWWSPLRQTTAVALFFGLSLVLIRLPFNLATNSFYSYNEPDFPIYWEVFNFFTSFVFVAIALLIFSGPVVSTIGFMLGGVLTGIGCTVHFLRRRGWSFQLSHAINIQGWISSALPFGFLQLMGLGLTSLPIFLVGVLVKIDEVTLVRATIIICQAILSLHLAHTMPIWTEFTQLQGGLKCGDKLLNLKHRMRRESRLIAAAFICLALVLPWVVNVWLSQIIDIRITTAYCVWGFGCGISNLYSLILNGGGRPMLSIFAIIPGVFIASSLAWLLAPELASYGIAVSFALGSILTALIMVILANMVMNLDRTSPKTNS
jgi:O-antigen/teichoic acid export membrane protein